MVIIWIACFFGLDSSFIRSCCIPNIVAVMMTALVVSIMVDVRTSMMTRRLVRHARFKAVIYSTMRMTRFIYTVRCPSSSLILCCPCQQLLMGLFGNVLSIFMIQVLGLGNQFLNSPDLFLGQRGCTIIE